MMGVLWPSSCLANEMWFECLLYAKLLNSDSRPVEAAVVPQAGTVLIALGLGSYWDCSSIYNLTGILTVESRGAKAHVGQQGETVRGTWVSGFALKLHWPFFSLCALGTQSVGSFGSFRKTFHLSSLAQQISIRTLGRSVGKGDKIQLKWLFSGSFESRRRDVISTPGASVGPAFCSCL